MKYDLKFITPVRDSEQNTVFNTYSALEGITLASIKTIQEGGETTEELTSVENFRQISSDKYVAIVDGVSHYFDGKGNCIDDSTVGNLTFVEGNIQKSIDNAAESGDSGGDEDKKATISSLNPRDYFAQEVMNGFMKNVDKPFSMSDADIYKYTTLAYKIAQSMINVSADNRSTDPESEGEDPPEVVVDPSTLNGNTEKLLNNMVTALTDINNSIEDSGGGGGESTFDGAITAWPSSGSININFSNIGADAQHPLHVTAGFPSRSNLEAGAIPNPLSPASPFAILTFNEAGNARYTYFTSFLDFLKDNTKSGLATALASAVLSTLSAQDIYDKIESLIDALIKSLIKQFAADLKTANPSITIPSNWTT